MLTRVFLDSNVLFSAFYHSQNCETLVQTHKDKKTLIVISEQVLEEASRNIKEKIPHQLSNFQTFLLADPPEIVADPKIIPPDVIRAVSPEDRSIFTSAVTADVDYFVTGNIKDFKRNARKKVGNVTVLTPKEAVERLGLIAAPQKGLPLL